MKWIRWVFLKIQSGHDSVHRRTDGQGDTSIPPFQLRWSGGYNNQKTRVNSDINNDYEASSFDKLGQLERLRSEDTPRRLMITNTVESYWIPSQKKTKSKLQI